MCVSVLFSVLMLETCKSPHAFFFLYVLSTNTAGQRKSAYRGNVLAGLTVEGAGVADTAFSMCSVKHPEPQLILSSCLSWDRARLMKGSTPPACLNNRTLGLRSCVGPLDDHCPAMQDGSRGSAAVSKRSSFNDLNPPNPDRCDCLDWIAHWAERGLCPLCECD